MPASAEPVAPVLRSTSREAIVCGCEALHARIRRTRGTAAAEPGLS